MLSSPLGLIPTSFEDCKTIVVGTTSTTSVLERACVIQSAATRPYGSSNSSPVLLSKVATTIRLGSRLNSRGLKKRSTATTIPAKTKAGTNIFFNFKPARIFFVIIGFLAGKASSLVGTSFSILSRSDRSSSTF